MLQPIPLGKDAYRRDVAGNEVFLINRYAEVDPTNKIEGSMLLSRPGTQFVGKISSDILRACFTRPGLFNGDLFLASTGSLFRYTATGINTQITTGLTGSDTPRYAWMIGTGYSYLFIVVNGLLYYYDGTTFANIPLPGSAIARAVCNYGGFIIVSVQDSIQFYFLFPGSTTIDSLNFESKVGGPDPIIDMTVISGQLVILGAASSEYWYLTGDGNAPFAPVQGNTHQRGMVGGTLASLNDDVLHVANDGAVWHSGPPWYIPQKVSNSGIEERIRESNIRISANTQSVVQCAWMFVLDGHVFYVLDLLIQGCLVYDVTTKSWCQFRTLGSLTFHMQCGTMWNQRIVGARAGSGELIELSPIASQDYVGLLQAYDIEHDVTAIIPADSLDHVSLDFVVLRLSSGLLQRQVAVDVRLLFSDDGGQTWSNPFKQTLISGLTSQSVYWGSLGAFKQPGRIIKIQDYAGAVRLDGLAVSTSGGDASPSATGGSQ